MDFLKDIVKSLDNKYATVLSDGETIADCEEFVDTGSYIFNALVSGSIYKGIPKNKVTCLAGDSGVGKTWYLISFIKNFLEQNETGMVVLFESESAVSKKQLLERGVDITRVAIVPIATVQEFRNQVLKLLDKYEKVPVKERQPLFIGLDSLGMLSTTKEMEDSLAGSETKDMTRTQIIRSIFRVITLSLGRLNVPLVFTNHIYDPQQMYASKVVSGGKAIVYAASTIIMLSKAKEKDGSEQVGNILRCTAYKSRFTKENSSCETRLFFDHRGLDKYYGLLELAQESGILTYSGGRYEIDGTRYYAKQILKEPEKYFTKELMDKLDIAAQRKFLYGTNID